MSVTELNPLEKKLVESGSCGIVAGNGSFPLEIAKELKTLGVKVFSICHKNETDAALLELSVASDWVKVGQLNKIIEFFKAHNVRHCVFAGGIRRFKLLGGVALDARALSILTKLGHWRDDALLRAVASEFEKEGIAVLSGAEIIKTAFTQTGHLAGPPLSADQERDAHQGLELLKEIGRLDIGQCLVLSQGTVIAVEAIEGTDAMLKRAGELLNGAPSVVLKASKIQQDQRLDMPTIGPRTITTMHQNALSALVIQAGKTIVLDSAETILRANKLGISLYAW